MKLEEKILLEENEIKPNIYASRTALFSLGAMLTVALLNFLKIFHVDNQKMIISLLVFAVCSIAIHILGISKETNKERSTKFYILGFLLVEVLVVSLLLFQWSEVTIVFPLLISLQYHNKKFSIGAFIGTIVISIISGPLAMLLGYLQSDFYEFLLRATGYDTSAIVLNASYNASEYIGKIMLYVSFPRVIICTVWGLLTIFTTKLIHGNIFHRARASHYMSTDILTGLFNRYSYEKKVREYENLTVNNPITIIYIDIDGLHTLNNLKGHSSGDEMLIYFAKKLQNYFGENVYRTGGDEFVVFIENSEDVAQSESIIETINKEGEPLDYHISAGLSIATSGKEFSLPIKEAESNMYKKKNQYYIDTKKDRRKQ